MREKITQWHHQHFGFGILFGIEAALSQRHMVRTLGD